MTVALIERFSDSQYEADGSQIGAGRGELLTDDGVHSSTAWLMAPLGWTGSASSDGGIVNRPAASGTLQGNSAPNGLFGTKENPDIWMNSSGSVLPGCVQVTVNPLERVTPVDLLGVEKVKPPPPPGQSTCAEKAPISAPPEPVKV